MSEVLVVGIDEDPASTRAVDFAVGRASGTGTRLCIVHVVPWSPYSFLTQEELAERHGERERELKRAQEMLIDPVASNLRGSGVDFETVIRHGHPAEVLCDIAREKEAKQIIVGRHGRTKLSERLFGSVPAALVQASPIPVTVVP